jgi:hypothetical protein
VPAGGAGDSAGFMKPKADPDGAGCRPDMLIMMIHLSFAGSPLIPPNQY